MTSRAESWWRQIEDLFQSALELEPAERLAFVDKMCAQDAELRREIVSLLESHLESDRVFGSPIISLAGTAEPDPPASEGQRIGPYRIVRVIRHGGMGSVYLAARADEQFRKQVAIKLVRTGLGSDFLVKRFLNERQILAGLEHPNIARLLDGGVTEQGQPYLVMEYVEGLPVDQYCQEQNLPVARRVELFRKICGAVQYAHQNLVVHRDLKPNNILVTADGEPKLLDFGIAKLTGQNAPADQTSTGLHMMTPLYASPEQIRNGPITTASDVYSLGVLLYELLTGKRPYRVDTSSPTEIAAAIVDQEPVRPSVAAESQPDVRRRLSGDLDNIALMALRKDPARRYSSVELFSEDLRRSSAGLPVIARGDTLLYRGSKFVRRHAIGVAAIAAVALALLTGAIVSMREAQRAERERAKAESIRRFMQYVLGSASPTWAGVFNKRGPNLKVSEMLDEASVRIGEEFKNDPDVEAELRASIGGTYVSLGLTAPGERELERALRMKTALSGEQSPAIAPFLTELAGARRQRGDYAESERLLRRALALQRSVRPADSMKLAMIAGDLGVLLSLNPAKRQEAEGLLKETLDLVNRGGGKGTIREAIALGNLGLIYDDRGDLAEARHYYEDAIAVFRRLPPAMELGWSLHNLGMVYRTTGDLSKARALLEEAIAMWRKQLGPDHPNIAQFMAELAIVRSKQGDSREAEQIAREAIRIQTGKLDPDHPEFGRTLTALGYVLIQAGRPADAEKPLRQAYAIRQKAFGDDNRRTAETEAFLGVALIGQKRDTEGRTLLAQGYRKMKETFGENQPRTLEVKQYLDRLGNR